MKDKNKFIHFSQYIFIQIIIPTVVIILFQQFFLLKPIVIIGHLFVISCINLLVILFGFFIFSRKFTNYQKITKYFISSLYGILNVLLYYTYLFSSLGKFFNSQIFTFQIVFGYLKYLDELIDTFSVSHLLVYSGLFIIPMLIFIGNLFLTEFIFQGILHLKRFILRHNFNNPPKFIRFNIVFFLLLFGFVSGVVLIKHSSISNRLFRMEEPFVSVFFNNNDPFQGQTMSHNNEDIRMRYEYPKNIQFQKKNIIVIIVDALRSDHLSLFGYKRKTSPFIDNLYSSGNLKKVDLSFSVAGASFAGINGILRSKIWSNIGYNNFSIQQLLKDQGYDINFLVSGDHTHFYGLKSFYGNNSDFNYYIDGSITKKYIVADDRIIFEGFENIKEYNNNPTYFHFHLNSAHSAGVKLDKYKIFLPANANAFNIENYTNRYDNGIVQADDYIKDIFKILSLKGYLKNSIVVITADHGEALGERGEFGHGKNVYTDQILIPILIYDSDTVKYKNLNFATSVDIAPTIIDRLGLPIPKSWEGNSLYSEGIREFTFHQMGEHYAVIYTKKNMRLKYIFDNRTKKEELFDLNLDLYETKNIIDSVGESRYVDILRNQLIHFHLNPVE